MTAPAQGPGPLLGQVTCSCCTLPFDYTVTCPYCPCGPQPNGSWGFLKHQSHPNNAPPVPVNLPNAP